MGKIKMRNICQAHIEIYGRRHECLMEHNSSYSPTNSRKHVTKIGGKDLATGKPCTYVVEWSKVTD